MAVLMEILWMLFVIWSAVVYAGSSCPKGSQIHLSTQRCYWISQQVATWSQALDSCRLQGGDVANANGIELQSFVHRFFSAYVTHELLHFCCIHLLEVSVIDVDELTVSGFGSGAHKVDRLLHGRTGEAQRECADS
ncbi:hypothetical protein WMY93_009841 [Mugilogobius chulae]|uniref:C-type lectin domain-containing protein n=1 Tax=Mugilogobius chulae TaxID=88201 RepID=A0AAW0PES9_9GOBI